MNKERIIALAELIEAQPHVTTNVYYAPSGFSMFFITHECGTPSCIAGWAAWEAEGRPDDMNEVDSIELSAERWLGVGYMQGQRLFYPDSNYYYSATPAQAAQVLRHMAETGKVDWSIIGEPAEYV